MYIYRIYGADSLIFFLIVAVFIQMNKLEPKVNNCIYATQHINKESTLGTRQSS